MVWPLRARITVLTTEEAVPLSALAKRSGRAANLTAPVTAISSSLAPPTPSTGSGRGRVGFGAAQLRHQVGAGHAVHRGVVHLGHHGQPAALLRVGARHAFDHPHLPQRAGAVQRQRGDVAADLGELDASARRRQTDPVQVPVDVKVVVLHPHRMVEVEGAVGQLLAELRHRLDPQRQLVAQPIEGVAARHRRRVELQNRADVQRLRWGFQIEEAGVESAEALHAPMVCPLPRGGTGFARWAPV